MTPERLAAAFDGPSPALAATLLGCRLTVVAPDGAVTVRLTETEAYGNAGADPGAHSFRGRTERNAALFGPPRRTYVYLNYGIHRCLNLVGHPEGEAGGVLLRAAEVLAGGDLAVARRGRDTGPKLLSGPGNLGQGLGVGGAGVQGGGEDLLGVVEELLVLGHEVGLGVDLDEDADLAVAGVDDLGGDEAGRGRAALALGDALQSLDADDLNGLLGVAVGLLKGLLDVEHAGAGLLAQRLDVSGGVVRHECLLVSQ